MIPSGQTKRFWRSRLPHWELEQGVYFLTIRCAGTLPSEVTARLEEIQDALQTVDPATEQFQNLQRRMFLTMEKYLDRGEGFSPFREAACCREVTKALQRLSAEGWHAKHHAIMPNHLHALLQTEPGARGMREVWSQWKGRTARGCNRILGRAGAFWQKDWFDRWMRDAASLEKTVAYIRNNPVKAGLVAHWEDYPWVR